MLGIICKLMGILPGKKKKPQSLGAGASSYSRLLLAVGLARADDGGAPVVGFKVGATRRSRTGRSAYLAHVHARRPDRPRGSAASSQAGADLERAVRDASTVTLEDAPGGVRAGRDARRQAVVDRRRRPCTCCPATARSASATPRTTSRGHDQKFLLYGQLGTQTSMFFGTFLDPVVSRHAAAVPRRHLPRSAAQIDEYANPAGDAARTSTSRASTERRSSTPASSSAGSSTGGSSAMRGCAAAYVYFRDPIDPRTNTPATAPAAGRLGRTLQARLTLDHRIHHFGADGRPVHAAPRRADASRASTTTATTARSCARTTAGVLFGEHELELRAIGQRRLPPARSTRSITLGGGTDLRGYELDQFRGDTARRAARRVLGAAVPGGGSSRSAALGVLRHRRTRRSSFPRTGDRDYLPGQLDRTLLPQRRRHRPARLRQGGRAAAARDRSRLWHRGPRARSATSSSG